MNAESLYSPYWTCRMTMTYEVDAKVWNQMTSVFTGDQAVPFAMTDGFTRALEMPARNL